MAPALKNKAIGNGGTRRPVGGDVIEMSARKSAPKGAAKSKVVVFQFGSASLKTSAVHDDWAQNIGLGQLAMKRITAQIVKPGVKMRKAKARPLFRADPANPGQLIRVLDGKEERGLFIDGVFQVRS